MDKSIEKCAECPTCKTKKREGEEQKRLINRLNRIEGQIRGIRAMVERDAYCIDIITQASAVSAALDSFKREMLSEHIRTCVAQGVKNGDEEKLDELIRTLDIMI